MENEEQKPKRRPKRKVYESDHYLYMSAELLKCIQQVPRLRPEGWNLEGPEPDDCELRYISREHAPLFYPWEEFDCRTIKLINLRKPACRLTFFRTHRYFLKKAEKITRQTKLDTIQEVIQKLQQDLDKLDTQTLFDVPTDQHRVVQDELNEWKQIAQHPDRYDIALSNYHKDYIYNTLNYKYLVEDPTDGYRMANETVHLLKNQYEKDRSKGRTQAVAQIRYNIVFIDLESIVQPDPYQNKVIHRYLEGFPIRTDMYLHHVYVRPSSEEQSSDPAGKI
ncbi:hypothetical protein [Spirosoma jeollabukense]